MTNLTNSTKSTFKKHHLIFSIIIITGVFLLWSTVYKENQSCNKLEPTTLCTSRLPITRAEVLNDHWVKVSYLSIHGGDEFREKIQFGIRHAVFPTGSNIGEVHYDKFNGIDVPFGTVAHLAVYISENTGLSEDFANGILWTGIILVLFFGLKYIYKGK